MVKLLIFQKNVITICDEGCTNRAYHIPNRNFVNSEINKSRRNVYIFQSIGITLNLSRSFQFEVQNDAKDP